MVRRSTRHIKTRQGRKPHSPSPLHQVINTNENSSISSQSTSTRGYGRHHNTTTSPANNGVMTSYNLFQLKRSQTTNHGRKKNPTPVRSPLHDLDENTPGVVFRLFFHVTKKTPSQEKNAIENYTNILTPSASKHGKSHRSSAVSTALSQLQLERHRGIDISAEILRHNTTSGFFSSASYTGSSAASTSSGPTPTVVSGASSPSTSSSPLQVVPKPVVIKETTTTTTSSVLMV